MINRYNITGDFDYDNDDFCVDEQLSDEGTWVRYDDIKHLLQNTSSNSDYVKCGCGNPSTIILCNKCYRNGSFETQDYPDFA